MTTGQAQHGVTTSDGPGSRRRSRAWTPALPLLGLIPFVGYCVAFLLLPASLVLVNAFRDGRGDWTTGNVRRLFDDEYLVAYRTSLEVSGASAFVGAALGTVMAYAAVVSGTPRWIRPVLTTFSGVAANFAGVPLAFAFIATLGTTGLVTRFLADHIGIDLYDKGFTLFGFWGVVLAYVYFQVPLMVLVIAPAIDGLKAEWREAAESLGSGAVDYWWRVGRPILTPSILGAFVLLFGNAFSAYATAAALTSGGVPLVPLEIGNLVSGNVLSDPHQAQALALGMVAITALTMVAYALLVRRAARWSA